MLNGEALIKGKKWQRQLLEGQALIVDQETLRQFIDVSVYAISKISADGCEGCIHGLKYDWEEPCASCKNNYTNKWEG